MAHFHDSSQKVLRFSSALYATEVKFRRTHRPPGNQQEADLCFSREYHLYEYENGFSGYANGSVIHVSRHHLCFRADVFIFWAEIKNHRQMIKNKEKEDNISNHCVDSLSMRSWAILFDYGMLGCIGKFVTCLEEMTSTSSSNLCGKENQCSHQRGQNNCWKLVWTLGQSMEANLSSTARQKKSTTICWLLVWLLHTTILYYARWKMSITIQLLFYAEKCVPRNVRAINANTLGSLGTDKIAVCDLSNIWMERFS